MINKDKIADGFKKKFARDISIGQLVRMANIIDYWESKKQYTDLRWLAYVLATAYHETAFTFLAIAEMGDDNYFDKYDPVLADTSVRRQRAITYGNTEEGDGFKYRGRGLCQVTFKSNYERFGRLLNIDLVNNPDLALDPVTAIKICFRGMELGMFTGVKLSHYFNSKKSDWVGARAIINGSDCAVKIAEYAKNFYSLLTT